LPTRVAVTLAATVVGLFLLVSFRTPPSNTTGSGVALLPARSSPSPSGSPPAVTPSGAPPSGGRTPAATATPTATGLKDGSFTGQVFPNFYGDVQVQVIVSGGRITDVKALQYPTDRPQSAYISSVAIPYLHDEVLKAQSAQIDIISGATFTSQSYAQSVQSALARA
jgi:uncharacterized protein with FMN-binding domain